MTNTVLDSLLRLLNNLKFSSGLSLYKYLYSEVNVLEPAIKINLFDFDLNTLV